MKKTGLAGIAVLLAFAVAACGGFLTDPEDTVKLGFDGYNEQGQEMVVVGIGGGEGRALTDTPLRQNKATFYEVAFKNGTNVYRTSWNKLDAATIRIPVGTYATAGDAILFAGTPDRTLIGIGILDIGSQNITSTTTNIRFIAKNLVNNIDLTAANSTFTSGSFVASEMEPLPVPGTIFKTPSTLPNTPIHPFAMGATISDAVYQICVDGTGGGNLSNTYNAGIYVYLNVADTPFSIGNSTFNGSTPFVSFSGLSITSPTTNTFPADGKFTLEFTTPGTPGFAELSLNIKANAIDNSTSPTGVVPLDWYIKGGLTNSALDQGVAADSEGGALLLAVGSALEMVEVGIESP